MQPDTDSRIQSVGGDLPPEAFTPRAEACFCAVVDRSDYLARDAQLIYQALSEQLQAVSFGDHLKRYIYRKAGIKQPFDRVPVSEYLDIMAESFASRGVPASFAPTSARLRAMAKNWLTQRTVSRDAVLLMGFGLSMAMEDVREMLNKGLQEPGLNPSDPRETLCGYCYLHGLGYHKYRDLLDGCMKAADGRTGGAGPVPASVNDLKSEAELVKYVSALIRAQRSRPPRNVMKEQFDLLYARAQETAAGILKSSPMPGSNGRTREEITPADIERVLQAAIPRDPNGNLRPAKQSALYSQLRGRRLTRQRLTGLLDGSAHVTRYDLLTLRFFVCAPQAVLAQSRSAFYHRFTEQTDRMLKDCGMMPLYKANPFECFLMMCMLAEDPLTAYSDVMERSYMEAAQ